jgi:hypothetical protein
VHVTHEGLPVAAGSATYEVHEEYRRSGYRGARHSLTPWDDPMANDEHVAILKKGVAAWNEWRNENPDIRPELSEANLNGADLSEARLRNANLREAHLSGTNLSRARLSGANLIEADLGGANLGEADLRGANLKRAHLSEAHLSGAVLYETIFGNVDLTSVIGLETCKHYGPSIIDHLTLQRSGTLPLAFLRGVGLPDNLIEYVPSLLNQAIQHYSCFISYSAKDQEFAERLHADLQNNGVRCWFALHDIAIGDKFIDAIDAAIRLRDKVLLILSKHSIQSYWVETEVSKAFAEERKRKQTVLFPIRLDDTIMRTKKAWAATLREQRHIGDLRRWKDHDAYKESFKRVLDDLEPPTKIPPAK